MIKKILVFADSGMPVHKTLRIWTIMLIVAWAIIIAFIKLFAMVWTWVF